MGKRTFFVGEYVRGGEAGACACKGEGAAGVTSNETGNRANANIPDTRQRNDFTANPPNNRRKSTKRSDQFRRRIFCGFRLLSPEPKQMYPPSVFGFRNPARTVSQVGIGFRLERRFPVPANVGTVWEGPCQMQRRFAHAAFATNDSSRGPTFSSAGPK